MGAIVGGIFGGFTGCWYAYQTRSFLVIPMVALTSGGSFGFFMGDHKLNGEELNLGTRNHGGD